MPRKMSVTALRPELFALIAELDEEGPIIIEHLRQEAAVLLSMEEYRRTQERLRTRDHQIEALQARIAELEGE